MKSVKWLRPYMTAASKYHGIRDTVFLSRKRREAMSSRYHWLPLTVEDLADETGDYIALSAKMVRWLMSIKVDSVANTGNGWHIPYRAFRVGVEDGSDVPPFIVCWMPAREYLALNPPPDPEGLAGGLDNYPPSSWFLYIGMRDYLPGGVPTIGGGTFNRAGIADVIRGTSDDQHLFTDDTNKVLRLTVALGIYLSLGVDAPDIPSAVSKKIAPPPRDRPAAYTLRTITEPPGGSGRTPHLVRPHVRCLKHERYYQGAWSAYPRGSRYSLVSAHVRGHQSETEHDADLHGIV